jgi:hydroxypyruvate isomerase
MQRRQFVRGSALASAAMLAGSTSQAETSGNSAVKSPTDSPFHLNYGIHDGMFENHAGKDFIDQIQFAYEHGFRSLEDNGLMQRTPERQQQIGDSMAKLGMNMGVFVLDKGGNGANSIASGKPEYQAIFLDACKKAVDVAKRVNATWITVVPGDFERHLPLGIQTAHVIDVLRLASDILAPHGLVMVLEPLSDTPDLFLRYSDQAYAICKAVNSPACKILCDMFHMQRNEGDIIPHMDLVWDEIGYFQIGNNPKRNEPGTGEMDYKNIFHHIYQKGFRGVLGMEHGKSLPGKEGELALIKAYREADDFPIS